MPEYDGARFRPPAPVAHVVVRNSLGDREARDIPMLIDSGADVTLLPRSLAATLALEILPRRYELVGFDGHAGESEAVVAAVVLASRVYRGQYLLIDQEWGILGRNILNTFSLTLDGPKQQWR